MDKIKVNEFIPSEAISDRIREAIGRCNGFTPNDILKHLDYDSEIQEIVKYWVSLEIEDLLTTKNIKQIKNLYFWTEGREE